MNGIGSSGGPYLPCWLFAAVHLGCFHDFDLIFLFFLTAAADSLDLYFFGNLNNRSSVGCCSYYSGIFHGFLIVGSFKCSFGVVGSFSCNFGPDAKAVMRRMHFLFF